MTSRPLTTLMSCQGAEKTQPTQHTFGRSTNWTRVFVEMKWASAPGCASNLYLDILLYHSLNHQKIENSESAALSSHGIWKLTKKKLSSIANVKTAFDSFFLVEDIFQWCRLFFFTRSACRHQIKTIGRASRTSNPSGSTGNILWDAVYIFWQDWLTQRSVN